MIVNLRLKKLFIYSFTGAITSFLIVYFYTNRLIFSLLIALCDLLLKTILFYFINLLFSKSKFIAKPAVIFLTGLSGSGKTTIAKSLIQKYKNLGVKVILLDGDDIRKYIPQTGFDEESRKKHNLNVGYMSSLLESQGHVVVVSLISPYIETRNDIRKMCKRMIEVYVKTDINICIKRDPKGLYAKAISGEIKEFTGISAPYYAPLSPEVVVDTELLNILECTELIFKEANK